MFLFLLTCLLIHSISSKELQELNVIAAQFNSISNIDINIQTMTKLIQTSSSTAHIISFPETSLTSYNASYIQTLSRETITSAVQQLQTVCAQSNLYCIIGTPWWSNATSQAVRQNAAVFIDNNGHLLGHQPKTMLVGPDLSWADPGQTLHTFPITIDNNQSITASIIICHDVRFAELVRLPVLRGARVVFYISWEQDDYANGAFPHADELTYRANVQARAFENRIYVVHSNALKNIKDPSAGSHGQSCVVSPIGRVVYEASEQDTENVVVKLNMTQATASYAREELNARSYLKAWWEEGMEKYVVPIESFHFQSHTPQP